MQLLFLTCFQQDDLIFLWELHEAWNHLCKFNNLLNNIRQSLSGTNPQILRCLAIHSKLIFNFKAATVPCSHHFLELVHFEVIDPLRATHGDLFSGQETSSLMSLEDGVREQLSNLVWIWNVKN